MGYGKAAAIVVDPDQPWTAWLSYGRNRGPHRVWRTDDYGRDWHLVGYEDTGLPTGPIFNLALDPSGAVSARTLYVAVDGQGIFKSEDGGNTWHRADSRDWHGQRFVSLALDPRNPQRLFVGVAYGRDRQRHTLRGGVWRSLDAGRTWTKVGDIPERPRIALAPSDPRIIYVGERDYSSVGRGGVWRSDDGGDTWHLLAERLDAGFGNLKRTYIGALAVDPRDANVAYAASVDEGYDLSSGKGVFVTHDGGKTWRPMNEGLGNFNVHNLAVDPSDPRRLYAGTGGDGFFRWGPQPAPKPLPPAPSHPAAPDPLCTNRALWHSSADKLADLSVHDEAFWWGRGYLLARLDTAAHGSELSVRFNPPRDISSARLVSLRLRGLKADGTRLCVSRIVMEDTAGRKLKYEKDILVGTTWELAELPLRDWEGKEGERFDRRHVRRLYFDFWAPYATGRPYEFAVGAIQIQ